MIMGQGQCDIDSQVIMQVWTPNRYVLEIPAAQIREPAIRQMILHDLDDASAAQAMANLTGCSCTVKRTTSTTCTTAD